jgi:hypothetical protein
VNHHHLPLKNGRALVAVAGGVAVAVAGVFACTLPLDVPTPTIQAPSFQFIERPRLQTAMWRLADDVTALELMLHHSEGEVERAEVVRILDDMESAAATISAPGQQTNHPRIDQELPRFLLDLAAAREAASRDPPVYRPAEELSSACVRCHSARR